MEIALHQTPENDYYGHNECLNGIDTWNKSMGNSITQHSLRFFGSVKSRPKWSLAGKYDYIISEYFSEFPTENVGNLVVGA